MGCATDFVPLPDPVEPLQPTEPRADDPAALVAEARKAHERGCSAFHQGWRCDTCGDVWSCLTARLADVLEREIEAQKQYNATVLEQQATMVFALNRIRTEKEVAQDRLESYVDLVSDLAHQRGMSVQKVSRYHEFMLRADAIIEADQQAHEHISELSKARHAAWEAEGELRAARSELAALRPVVEAAREWRDVIGGKLTVPPQAYLDAECRLASAVDAQDQPQ